MPSYRFAASSWLMFVSSAVAFAMAYIIWKRYKSADARYLAMIQLACAMWALFGAFDFAATTVQRKVFWSVMSYPWLSAAPPLFALFALAHTRRERGPSRVAYIAVLAVPVLATVAAITNPWHRLLWPHVTIDPATNLGIYAHGPFFWVLVAMVYTSFSIGIILLVRDLSRAAHIYKRQVAALLAAVVVPVAGNILYISGIGPPPGMDWTPVSFVVTAAMLTWALFGLRMFELVPIARHRLIESMTDALFVLDAEGGLVELNPAALDIVGRSKRELLGQRIGDVLPGIVNGPEGDANRAHLVLPNDDGAREYDVRLSAFGQTPRGALGSLVVLRDVTRRVALERERQALLDELTKTLAEVKALGGLLPICTNCKKIRDDDGYWRSVEAHVMAHSDAQFTHGICPECRDLLYPGLFDDEDTSQSLAT